LARKLFGTDGVRGVAGELLTAELALALGRAATLQATARAPRVLLIRDTRESGEMLEAALAAGITAAGGDVLLGGVLPRRCYCAATASTSPPSSPPRTTPTATTASSSSAPTGSS
jgi:phosphomannomutase